MSLIIETNSFNINAIPCDKVVLIVNKRAMLRDIREKSSNKGAKSVKKGVNSVNTKTKLHNNEVKITENGAKITENGAKITENGAISVINVQNRKNLRVLKNLGKI